MKRCGARHNVNAVRGQKGKDGKPIIVAIPCNLGEGHGGPHANEVRYEGTTAVPIRGTWASVND
jgi:hypothetical protein